MPLAELIPDGETRTRAMGPVAAVTAKAPTAGR
jgi:hypothetical protein